SKAGATVDVVEIPFPFSSGKDLMDPILAGVHRKTRLALLDHITSPTGVLMPMAAMVSALQEQGVQVLVDGAPVPGQVQVSLSELGADFFTGNCHKWLCTPIGSALLHVPMRNQDFVRPPVVSHGRNTTLAEGRSRFTEEFDWTGTFNPTPWLSIPTAIESIESMMEGGWPAIQERNHELALAARDLLCSALGIEHPVPDDYLASLVSIPLPPGSPKDLYADLSALGFEVPVMAWPPTPPDGHLGRCIRLSCQLYNSIDDYERLAEVLPCLLARA
ncbi:MAG: aminotransferase class V-fold PLP-dependent enzyme, partial [Planctomycetes bacterium]|nr:aminotransferase class V-fold PLP-dependent enzyme [Planctomycetota bacterium]